MVCSIALCIPTYKRPLSLSVLLLQLDQLDVSGCCDNLEILVIDNDCERSGRHVCENYTGKFQLKYIVQKDRGFSFVRNAAVDAVKDRFDFLCFLDDDELPSRMWLYELVQRQKQTGADCVYGPVHPVLPPDAPAWISKGRFFDPPPFRENDPALSAGAGNLLISCAFLRRTGLRFDPRFNLTGGEDTFFLLQGKRQFGLKAVGASKAVVRETVQPERATLGWILRRKFRIGNSLVRAERFAGMGAVHLAVRAAKGCGHVAVGLLTVPLGLFAGRHVAAAGLRRAAFGFGIWIGFICRYDEHGA